MKKISTIWLLIFCGIGARAQTTLTQALIPNLVPPSPNASSLAKYADWPVNLYTGVPSISVPVYTVKSRGLTLPVTLNYHASGIKVGETASWVGLGWSLDAGGVITRSVRGLPDEVDPQGYFAVRKNFPTPGDLSNIPPNFDTLYVWGAAHGKFDLESDIYMFNAMGTSFKFYFNGHDSVITQPNNDVRIKWTHTDMLTNSTFEADLDDGTQLFFTAKEITTLQTNLNIYVSQANTFISAWYLTKILSNNGDEIDLTYNGSSITQNSHISETDPKFVFTCGGSCGHSTTVPTVSFNAQSISQLSVATIESPLEKVFFIRDTVPRQDLNGDYALKNIKVLSKLTNSYIQDTRFIYSYSTSSGGLVPAGQLTATTDTGSYTKRLKLMEVQDCLPNTSTKIKGWLFNYNPTSLASRRTAAQDHWGYNNGALTNSTLMPYIPGFESPSHKSGNREPDSNYVQAEILNQIIYPTGGYSKFTYEANSYVTTQEVFQDTTAGLSYDLSYPLTETTLSKSFSFYIKQKQLVNVSMHGIYSSTYIGNHTMGHTMPTATIMKVGGSAAVVLTLSATGSTSATAYLDTGSYQLILLRDTSHLNYPPDSNYSSVSTKITYQTSKGIQTFNKLVGGIRIKAIDDFDSATSAVIHRQFKYESPLWALPINNTPDYVTTMQQENQNSSPDGCAYDGSCFETDSVRNSSTKYALGSEQGGVIGYGKVTTLYGVNGQNGKTVSYFNSFPDALVYQSHLFPYAPPISYEWRRGLLLNQVDSGADGHTKKSLAHGYNFKENDGITTCKVGLNKIYQVTGYYYADAVARVFYDIVGEEVMDTSMTTTIFSSSGTDSTVTTVSSYWDNPAYMKSNRTDRYDSKGYKHSEVVRYPKDYLSGGTSTGNAVLDSMISKNIFSPIEKRDSLIVGSTHYIMGAMLTQNKRLSTGSIQPDKIYKLAVQAPISDFVAYNASAGTMDSRYSREISFDSYDSSNNVAQFTPKTASSSSYIWDYKRQYPIAEVKSSALSDIAYTSFESDGKGGWTFTGTPITDATSPTGTKSYNLANGSVSKSGLTSSTTYIVSYWTKNGSYTVTNGGTAQQGKTINGWTYYEHQVTGTTSITVSGSGSIDELRLYPSKAQMTTYTFLPAVGVSNINDVGNRISYFMYDSIGRLIYKMDQDRNVIGKNDYSFATHAFYNSKRQQSFTRNNCGTGYNGSAVVYTVDSGKYSSPVSKVAADSIAQADINANGQNYANTNGTCTVATTSISATVFGSISGFKVTYTNTSTLTAYQFTIPSTGGSLGSIPLGTYNINISKTGNTTTYYMSVNCDAYSTDGTSATFNNIVIGSGTCTTVHLDTRL